MFELEIRCANRIGIRIFQIRPQEIIEVRIGGHSLEERILIDVHRGDVGGRLRLDNEALEAGKVFVVDLIGDDEQFVVVFDNFFQAF